MRSLASALLLLGCLVALAYSAPGPVSKHPIVYFPTQVGTRWVLAVGEVEETFVVTAVEQNKEGKVVSVAVESGKTRKHQRKVLVSEKEVTDVEFGGTALDPPDCLLKNPESPNIAWNKEEIVGSVRHQITRICRMPEAIEVPAGKFQAIRVDEERIIPGAKSHKTSSWYAPGVGLIKFEREGGDTVVVLKTFQLKKD